MFQRGETILETSGNWSRTNLGWVSSSYLSSYSQVGNAVSSSPNSRLGNYYINGYKLGVVCTVTKISRNCGYTARGWICLDYCIKL